MKIIFLFGVIFTVIHSLNCCNTEYKKEIHYNVVDCDEDSIAVGVFKADADKPERQRRHTIHSSDHNTCNKRPRDMFTKNKDLDPNIRKEVLPSLVSGKFVYFYYVAHDKIFYGVDPVIHAIRNNATLNILVDDSFDFVVVLLKRNFTDRNREERVMKKSEFRPSDYKNYELVECESLFRYLATISNPRDWSVTITNRYNSNMEHRFWQLTGGIAGFYKRSYSTMASASL